MPQSLHAELARVAEQEGVSLNTLITGALASSVAWRDGAVDGLALDEPGGAGRPARGPSARAGPRSPSPPTSCRRARSRRSWPSCCWSSRWATAGSRSSPPDRERARPRMGRVAITRRTEPWSALLEAGRSDDRLVREAYEGARAPRLRGGPRRPAPDASCRAWPTPGSTSSTATRHRRSQHAWEATTIVTTGTASGKSLCFNLPTLEVLCTDAKARALYLYPTKALAQDQARALNAFGLPKQVRPAIYDGDTKREERLAIRRRVEPRAHQPRHAARRDPAQPRRVGGLLRQPRRRRGRRGARLPRRLRRARRQRPAPAAARRRRLRRRRRASCSPARRSPTRSSWPSA